MIEGLKPYPEYAQARLPWLDVVPRHWDMVPNRALLRNQRQVVGDDAANYTLLSLTLGGVVPRDMETPKGKFPAEFNTYKVVRPKDIIFCLFDVDETPRAVGLSKQHGMITGAYDVFTLTRRVNCRFLHYYYLFVDNQKLLKPLYTGLRKTIQRSTFASLKTPCPPHDEQTAIVRFLDSANLTINSFIVGKRKLIRTLTEQKQSIVHRAVTRGLDPGVKLKPSEVPWVGEIPKHWGILRAKYLFREVDERSETGIEELLSVSHLTGVTPRREKNITMFKAASYVGHKICRPGDLAINTMWAWMGALGVAHQEGIVSPAYAVYRFRGGHRMLGTYVELLLRTRAYTSNFICRSTGVRASRLRLYPEEFFRIPVLVPPIDEQARIIEYIDGETSSLNTIMARTEREIALMQEFRTRLTADIVTGKLDVREAASTLPDLNSEVGPVADAGLIDQETLDPEVEDSDE